MKGVVPLSCLFSFSFLWLDDGWYNVLTHKTRGASLIIAIVQILWYPPADNTWISGCESFDDLVRLTRLFRSLTRFRPLLALLEA